VLYSQEKLFATEVTCMNSIMSALIFIQTTPCVGVLDGLMGAGFTIHLGNPVAFQ
jgi:hypothetical protein